MGNKFRYAYDAMLILGSVLGQEMESHGPGYSPLFLLHIGQEKKVSLTYCGLPSTITRLNPDAHWNHLGSLKIVIPGFQAELF